VRKFFNQGLIIILVVIGIFALLELAFRYQGYPEGDFNFARGGENGALHPANSTIRDLWGPIPFTATSNNLGYRGITDVSLQVPDGRFRIAMFGDSFTYGFFCDDYDTYPHQLQIALNKKTPGSIVDVVNFGVPGSSIEDVIGTYRKISDQHVDFNIAVINISANDVKDTAIPYKKNTFITESGKSSGFFDQLKSIFISKTTWLLCHSALAEQLVSFVLAEQFPDFMAAKKSLELKGESNRYDIVGMRDSAANIALYANQFKLEMESTEGPWDDNLIAKSLAFERHLQDLVEMAKKSGSMPVLVYLPSYYQVYNQAYTGVLNKKLAEFAGRLNVPFFDATNTLRQSSDKMLFLMPRDGHMSPSGNHALGEVVSDFFLKEGLVGKR
jgi:hypothetical protein